MSLKLLAVKATSPPDTVELVISVTSEWDADPLLFKRIKDTIAQLQKFIASPEFPENFPGSEGLIVVESLFSPPPEIKKILAKEGIQIRSIAEHPNAIPLERLLQSDSSNPSPAKRESASAAHRPSSQKATPSGGSKRAATTTPAPQSEGGRTPTKTQKSAPSPPQRKSDSPKKTERTDGSESKSPPPAAEKKGVSSKSTDTSAATASPNVSAKSQQNTSPLTSATSDNNTYEDEFDVDPDVLIEAEKLAGRSKTALWIGSGLLIISALLFFFSFSGSKASEAPEVKVILPKEISAKNLPAQSLAQISVTPDPQTFFLIPVVITDRPGHSEEKYYILFGVQETKKLLVFSPVEKSGIVEIKREPHPDDPTQEKVVPKWAKEFKKRSYEGRLEKLQREKNGPLELILPTGEHRDLSALYKKKFGIIYPLDAMVLLVGEDKLRPEGSSSGILLALAILFALAGAGVLMAYKK